MKEYRMRAEELQIIYRLLRALKDDVTVKQVDDWEKKIDDVIDVLYEIM